MGLPLTFFFHKCVSLFDISVVSLCLFSEQKLAVSIETSPAWMFDLSTSLAHSSRKVKVYSVTESHLVSFLQNSQPCWVLLAPAASSAPPLLGLFSNQINPSPFSTRHKHSCARALFLHSVTPSKKSMRSFIYYSSPSGTILSLIGTLYAFANMQFFQKQYLFICLCTFCNEKAARSGDKWSMGILGRHIQLWCKFRCYLFEMSHISANR